MDISRITDNLYVAARPETADLREVQDLELGLIISMIFHIRPPEALANGSTEVLWLRTIDFPLLPIPVKVLARGVEAALPVIESGRKVMVFCRAGRHRSVAMAACILIGQGSSADEAMDLVKAGREVADPRAGHIQRQIRRFEAYWLERRPPLPSPP